MTGHRMNAKDSASDTANHGNKTEHEPGWRTTLVAALRIHRIGDKLQKTT